MAKICHLSTVAVVANPVRIAKAAQYGHMVFTLASLAVGLLWGLETRMGRGRDHVADFLAEMQVAINELPYDAMTPADAVHVLTALREVAARHSPRPPLRLLR